MGPTLATTKELASEEVEPDTDGREARQELAVTLRDARKLHVDACAGCGASGRYDRSYTPDGPIFRCPKCGHTEKKVAGISMEELSRRLGFATYKSIWLIETGRMAIPPDKIPAFEAVLGLPPWSLFWAECRARLLLLGFNVDAALEAQSLAADPAEKPTTL